MARGTGHLIPFLGTLPLRWDLSPFAGPSHLKMKSPPSLGPNSVAAALVFAGPLKKIFVKKYIPIRLKICMPLGLTVRLASLVEFWGKSKILPHLWPKSLFFDLFLPQRIGLQPRL